MKKMGINNEHEIIKTKFEIQEQALKNIIQEIHENIGQVLSLAKLHLGTLDFSRPDEVAQKTLASNHLIGKAIRDLRYLARHLDATYVSRIGLYKAIVHETGSIPRDRASDPVLTLHGTIGEFAEEEELMIFRSVQEAIQYYLKSHETSLVSVHIDSTPDSLYIYVEEKQRIATIHEHISPQEGLNEWLNDINERSLPIGAITTYHTIDQQQSNFTIRFSHNKHKPS